MRLFAAVRPPQQVLEHLAAALSAVGAGADVAPDAGRVRWTVPENWHLTLAFYGEVPDGAQDELDAALAEGAAGVAPFALRLRGAGVFSGRTLWVGSGGDLEPMVELSLAARRAGGEVTSWEDERVRSRPHLTVGRVTPARRGRSARRGGTRHAGPDDVDRLVRALAVYEGPTWDVRQIELVRSEPGRGRGGGPLYTPVSVHPLGPAPVAAWGP
jgi:RNA 2',3'-cyclic 3'-phosphodiesterase